MSEFDVILYTRRGCCLCDQAKVLLESMDWRCAKSILMLIRSCASGIPSACRWSSSMGASGFADEWTNGY